jgi:phenylpyruvate tautomerase PptA (4-oxalocrotonate tautomerase family)
MPLVRINLAKGKSPQHRRAIGDVIYEAMRSTIDVPKDDRFQLFCEYEPGAFHVDPTYLDIQRGPDWLIIEIVLREGRTVDMKRALYKAIADGLHERLNVRTEDVFITLIEVRKENWSFGNGLAQYAM